MHHEIILSKIRNLIKQQMSDDHTGHDYRHAIRVWKTARIIAETESCNLFIVELSALLHDLYDWKFYQGDLEIGQKKTYKLLRSFDMTSAEIEHTLSVIREISFKGANVPDDPSSIEAQIVQDADRLDAIGAIGIARAFACGSHFNQPIHDPDIIPVYHNSASEYFDSKTTTLNHFDEKLLLLKDRMHTEKAKKIAETRHNFMLHFLEQFHSEWAQQDCMR